MRVSDQIVLLRRLAVLARGAMCTTWWRVISYALEADPAAGDDDDVAAAIGSGSPWPAPGNLGRACVSLDEWIGLCRERTAGRPGRHEMGSRASDVR